MRILVAVLLAFGSADIALAGVRDIPLDELVRDSVAILTGEVVEKEQGEISPGVLQKTLSIRVGHVLKGQPTATKLARVVRIRFLDGPNVPSGKLTFDLGDRGIWFLYPAGEAKGSYQAAMRYDEAREEEVREKLAALPKYQMQLVWMAGTQPPEFIFVVGQVGFRSLDAFKEFVGRLPKGSTLEWNPGCKRMGGEPLLSSQEEMEAFRRACETGGINFVLVPSG